MEKASSSPSSLPIERWGRKRFALAALFGYIVLTFVWQRGRVNIAILSVNSLDFLMATRVQTNDTNSSDDDLNQTYTSRLVPFVPHNNNNHSNETITARQQLKEQQQSSTNDRTELLVNMKNDTPAFDEAYQKMNTSATTLVPTGRSDNNETNATLDPSSQQSLPILPLPRPHPHAGARDEFGQWGYIHDPTYVKNHPLPFTHYLNDGNPAICATPFGEGEERATGYEGLKLVEVANTTDSNDNNNNSNENNSNNNSNSENYINNNVTTSTPTNSTWPKVLCIIYTHSGRHDTMLKTVLETWAPYCDGFMAASNVTNRTLGAVDLPHEGPEIYQEMWNKVKSIWAYVHDNYMDDYDYFHIGGDDMYVIPQNLRQFVATLSSNSTTTTSSSFQYLGGIMMGRTNRLTYCGGMSGYTLNRATLTLLVKTIIPICGVNRTTPQEDVMVATCFHSYNKAYHCNDTRDAVMATRYHMMGADWQVEWSGGFQNVMGNKRLTTNFGFSYTSGPKGLSRSSIAFHLKNPSINFMERRMRRYHAILYPHICQSWNTTHQNVTNEGAMSSA